MSFGVESYFGVFGGIRVNRYLTAIMDVDLSIDEQNTLIFLHFMLEFILHAV